MGQMDKWFHHSTMMNADQIVYLPEACFGDTQFMSSLYHGGNDALTD